MKTRERTKHRPILLAAGDVITLELVERENGIVVSREPLASSPITEPCTVDTSILFDLEPEEAAKLGLEHGIGGLIGKEA